MAVEGNGSDEIINFKCCLCAKKDKAREAETYCVDCQDYYCTPCTDLHKLFPSAIGVHQFIDKSNFSTAGTQKALPSCPIERCVIHNTKLLDMYCAHHEEIVCATCVALNHRTCEKIHSVSDEVDSLYEKSAANETKEQLLETKANMEDMKNAKEHLVTELDKYKESTAESIKHFRKEMDAVLDTLEKESIRELEEEYREIRKHLEDEIKTAEKLVKKLQLSSEKLSKSFGNKAQEFVCVKIAKKTILETKKSEIVLSNAVNVEITFTADSEIKAFVNEFTTLGKVSVYAPPKTTLYEVKNRNQINIKQANERSTCDVRGSCFTEDGLLLLTDYNNKKLKRVNLSSESIKDSLDLEASPYAVCQTGKKEIAVNLYNQTIQFVSCRDKLSITKQLKLDHGCRGLAYKDGRLFVSDSSTALYIHDMNGAKLHKITTNQQGNAIFSSNRQISLGSNEDRIHITDQMKGLISLDLQGKYESIFTDSGVVQPYGICSDGRGNVFVCGYRQSHIIQMNEKTNKSLGLIDSVTNSRSACFNPDHNILVVTMNSYTVNIYKLE